VTEVVKGALAAGVTLGTLIIETAAHPSEAMNNLTKAFRDLGQTMADIYQAVIVETAAEFIDQVTIALVEIGEAAFDILAGVLEIAGGFVDTVIIILFELLGSYRELTDDEKADAERVFGDSIDLNKVAICKEGLFNDIVFGVQDFFIQLGNGNFSSLTDETDSRAFTTGNLINFDVDEDFDRPTFIHEMTHVWQNQNVGPIYMAHAIFSQQTDGYNYGYSESGPAFMCLMPFTMDGHQMIIQKDLLRGRWRGRPRECGGDFDAFNPEQQGQIVMQYFVREVLFAGAIDTTPFEPYIATVQDGMPERV
jgi:hypothetical protein